MCQAIVFIVLREVETHLLTVGRDPHGDEAVDEFVAQPAHSESIAKYDDDGQQMVKENDEAVPSSRYQSLLNKDSS